MVKEMFYLLFSKKMKSDFFAFRTYIRFLLLCGLAKSKLLFFEDFLYKEGF